MKIVRCTNVAQNNRKNLAYLSGMIRGANNRVANPLLRFSYLHAARKARKPHEHKHTDKEYMSKTNCGIVKYAVSLRSPSVVKSASNHPGGLCVWANSVCSTWASLLLFFFLQRRGPTAVAGPPHPRASSMRRASATRGCSVRSCIQRPATRCLVRTWVCLSGLAGASSV